MKTNPLMIFTGLAIAALAGLLAITRDRWYGNPEVAAPMTVLEEKAEQPKPTPTVTPERDVAVAKVEATAEPVTPAIPDKTQVEAVAKTGSKVESKAEVKLPPVADEPAGQTAVIKTDTSPAVAAEPVTPTVADKPAAQTAVNKSESPEPAEEKLGNQSAEAAKKEALQVPELRAGKADAAPQFDTVRVEKTGEAVIAGRAEAGAEVTIRHNGKPIGTAVANSDGAFVLVPDAPLPAGNGALTLEARGNGADASQMATETVAVAIPERAGDEAMVAVVSPDKPTKVLQKPQAKSEPVKATPDAGEQVQSAALEPALEQPIAETPSKPAAPQVVAKSNISLDAVDYDAAGNIVFSGRGNSGSPVRLYVDNQAVGEATTDAEGRWTFSGAARIAPGTHRLRVDELASGGAVSSRVELPFFREDVSKVALAAPAEKPLPEAVPPPQPEVSAVVSVPELTAPAPSPETQAALVQAPPIEAPKDGRIVIQPGNNLWKLSRVIYGKGVKFTVIFEANKEHIRDPDLIYPGQIFMTPDVVPPESIDPVRRKPLTLEEGGATAQ